MGSTGSIEKTKPLTLKKPWTSFALDKKAIQFLEENVFYDYMRQCRWFAGKARMIKFLKVQQILNMPIDGGLAYFIILHVGYTYGDEEKYAMPVSFLPDDYELLGQINPKAFITKVVADGKPGWLIDAIYDFRFQTELFKNISYKTWLYKLIEHYQIFSMVQLSTEDEGEPKIVRKDVRPLHK